MVRIASKLARTVRGTVVALAERWLLDDVVQQPVQEQFAEPAMPVWRTDLLRAREHYFGPHYRIPNDLAVTRLELKRILVVGSCLVAGWPQEIRAAQPRCDADYVLFNNLAELPAAPPAALSEYDFQIVQIPLRSVMPDYTYFRLPHDDAAAYTQLFQECRERLGQFIDAALQWNRESGLLTFVANFMAPQQNPLGRLLPRYDLRNPVHFIEQLNVALVEELVHRRNVHVLDLDQLSANFGRRHVQDDSVWPLSHGTPLTDADFAHDQQRIEPVGRVAEYLPLKTSEFFLSAWADLVAMFRTVRQIDAVKLVVIDLDDTLWRGVVAESRDDDFPPHTLEGWPLGLVEALCYLKKRGVLLAIASKNDPVNVERAWSKILMGRLLLEDFAVRCINWEPKAHNLERILAETNLLPRNVVFVDDNPVERAAMKAAFPDVRVIGSHPYYMRQILLWAPETQVAAISNESGRRTEMVQAQIERESQRKRLSREEFLGTLGLKVRLVDIGRANHPAFPRAFELLNKTNQFNTTGKRWTQEQVTAAFDRGETWLAVEAEDRFSNYGLIAVAWANGSCLEQFVMSCRVVGLGVEGAVIASLAQKIKASGHAEMSARFLRTDANHLCSDMYPRSGFSQKGEMWLHNLEPVPSAPRHVQVTQPS